MTQGNSVGRCAAAPAMATTHPGRPVTRLPFQGPSPYPPSWCCLLPVHTSRIGRRSCLYARTSRGVQGDIAPFSPRMASLPACCTSRGKTQVHPRAGWNAPFQMCRACSNSWSQANGSPSCAGSPQLCENGPDGASGCRVDKSDWSLKGAMQSPGQPTPAVNMGVRCNSSCPGPMSSFGSLGLGK